MKIEQTKIKDVMSTPALTCGPEDTLNLAAQIMWEKDCGCLPVVDRSGELVGMITDRDICMAAYIQGVPLSSTSVGSAMSQPVVSCRVGDGMGQVEQLMKERAIRRVPVLNDEGALCGIVTVGDLARNAEVHGLRGTISAPGIARTLAAICTPRSNGASAAA